MLFLSAVFAIPINLVSSMDFINRLILLQIINENPE